MLYQRYFLRMNQSNMTHVLGLLAGLAFALGMLLMLRLVVEDSQQFLATLERPENLSLAVTLVVCVAIYAGEYQKIKRQGTKSTKSLPPNHWTNLWRERFPSRAKTSPETKTKHTVQNLREYRANKIWKFNLVKSYCQIVVVQI